MRWPALRPTAIVLLYHRVAAVKPDPWALCVTPEHFEQHLSVLQRYRRMRLDRIQPGEWAWNGPAIAITFDDGYADNFLNARPLLESYDTPATFFITTGAIDAPREFWWDELERGVLRSGAGLDRYFDLYQQLQPLPHQSRCRLLDDMFDGGDRTPRPTHRTLTSDELKELASCGLFEIGAHTVTHPLLSAQAPEIQEWELVTSRKWLEHFLDRRISSVSYPYGGTHHYNQATLALAAQAGYRRACTTVPLPVGRRTQPWEWGRFVVSDMDGDQFQRFLRSC